MHFTGDTGNFLKKILPRKSGDIAPTTTYDNDLFLFQKLVHDRFNTSESNRCGIKVETSSDCVSDDFRLLVDLFEHEMFVVSLSCCTLPAFDLFNLFLESISRKCFDRVVLFFI